MNTKHSLHCLLIMAGTALFLVGCGPENLDDPSYYAEDSFGDAAQEGNTDGMKDDDQNKNRHMNVAATATVSGGAPAAVPATGAAVPATGVAVAAAVPAPVPVPVVEAPPRFVELPPVVEPLPPVITNSLEDRNFKQTIIHERKIIRPMPTINQHLIRNNMLVDKKFHTTIINQPSFRNDVAMTSTYAEVAEVLPTTEVTAPAAVLPGVVAPLPVPVPPCAPYLSGGFFRACRPPVILPQPVVGPYWR